MSFKITILGSSAALPAYGRFPSAQLLEIQSQYYLIDCGEGTQMQLSRFQYSCLKINHIFISHLHGDHYLGLMGLLFSMHLKRRTTDLHLHGPAGLDDIIVTHLRHARSALHFKIHFHPIDALQSKTILEEDGLTVDTIILDHRIACTGFLFREKTKPRKIDKTKLIDGMLLQHIAALKTGIDVMDEQGRLLYKNEAFTLPPRPSFSYAYCSDTAYSPSVVDAVRGVSLLYHEATFMESESDKASETFHSTAAQAASAAKQAGVEQLVLGHFSARYRELDDLLAEAQAIFPNTALATEGKIFEIEP